MDLLRDDGAAFGLDDLKGRWTFAFFGFTSCPDICPTSMATLGQADRLLREQGLGQGGDQAPFQGVLVSVDPERDNLELLGRYVRAFSPGFVGVTGAHGQLAEFAGQLSATFMKVPEFDEDGNPKPDEYQVDHTANIVIINPYGHYHGFIKYPQQAATIAAAYQALAANF